ncbi:MAG: sulfatase-like hydrolase/transferase [bacterium]
MGRPEHSRRSFACALGLALALGACGRTTPRALILVTIDTCRADRLGCYGGKVETPTLDDLARRGVLFEDVSAPAPLTLPSHCSVLTGLYPDRHGVRDNGAGKLPASARTLAEILADAGFRTAAFVSAFPLEKRFGADQGFQTFDDRFTGSAAHGEGRLEESARVVATRLFYEERAASDVVDAAAPWLREAARGRAPFFLWIHFFDPHAVYRPPARFALKYGAESYEGEIAYVDEQLGRLLKELGGRRNVTVAVVADHGESLGEHGEATHGLFVYQSTIRVPWIVAGPGYPAGRRVATPVSLVDVMPTLLSSMGIAPPGDLDGESRQALFAPGAGAAGTVAGSAGDAGADRSVLHGECLAAELHYDWAPLRFARRGRWKLIDAPTPELYDVAADPGEVKNVAAEHADVVDSLRAEMDRQAARGGALPSEEIALDASARERLERLGYVGGGAPRAPRASWPKGGKDPKDMVDFFNRLQSVPTLMVDGHYDEAERTLLDLRREDPQDRDVVDKLAVLARTRENWAAARDWCRESLRLDPDDVDMRMNLAAALAQLHDLDGAKAAYREVCAREPKRAEAWALLGSVLSQDGAHADAIAALEHAAELAPSDAGILATHAHALDDAGRKDAALAEYDRALAADAALPAAVNGKALLLAHEGRPQDAVKVLEAAMPALEKDVDALNNLAWILADRSIDAGRALEVARKARALAPEDAVVLDTFGWAAVRAGHATEAVEPLERAWKQTKDAETRVHLAAALAAVGRTAEARDHARAAVAARPELAHVEEVARLLR